MRLAAASCEDSSPEAGSHPGCETSPRETRDDEDPTPDAVHDGTDEYDAWSRPALYAAIVTGFRVAGAIRRSLSDKTLVTCPYVGGHTNADSSGTVVMGNGSVKCHHGSCGGRTQPDFLVALPDAAQAAIVAELPALLPDDFRALYLPSILKVAARVRLLDPTLFERTLHRMLNEDALPCVGQQNRISQWYARVRSEKVV